MMTKTLADDSTKPGLKLSRTERLALLGPDHADTVVTDADRARAQAARALTTADMAALFDESAATVAACAAANRAAFNADGLDVWA